MRIGLDFDNTIICYDEVFAAAARERKLVPAGFKGGKREVRDAVRALPDGERTWQALQGHVYGHAIVRAKPFPGLHEFLRRARAEGAEVVVVSHKTEYGHHDAARVNLREAALDWLEANGFFSGDYGLSRDDIHFAGTRDEKLRRIAAIGPHAFIDDLPEVLDDPKFPLGIQRLLFSSDAPEGVGCVAYGDWKSLEKAVFDGRG